MEKIGTLVDPYPSAYTVDQETISQSVDQLNRIFVVLDDDPTGTQSVADVPVLLSWEVSDLQWALETGARAVYVMTNSRSLDPDKAREITREVVQNSLSAAERTGVSIGFISRSDSTLRGHFPLETETIREQLDHAGWELHGVCLIPAFPDAGRVTVGLRHYAGNLGRDEFVEVSKTEFAQDATFGFRSSHLAEWIKEKRGPDSQGVITEVDLETIRSGPEAVEAVLEGQTDFTTAVFDCVVEDDLKVIAHSLRQRERQGAHHIYRVGPPFVRSFIGQERREPLGPEELAALTGLAGSSVEGGLVVVGSHTDLTTQQLAQLRESGPLFECELDVGVLLDGSHPDQLDSLAEDVAAGLSGGDTVVLSTSRTLAKGNDARDSLSIARQVSAALCHVVETALAATAPRFVIAKGGITSSDIASKALGIRRAIVRGSLLPGLVSLWLPEDGMNKSVPYVVFPGNVGDEHSLAAVVQKLRGEK